MSEDFNAIERNRWGGPSPWAGKDSRTDAQKAAEPVFIVTREQAEDLAGRKITDEEAARISKAIEYSTASEAVASAVEQVCGLPPEEE